VNDQSQIISDEDPGRVVSTIDIDDLDGNIVDVNVSVDIEHTWVSDLRLILVSPDGTRVSLVRNEGGDGQDFAGTQFDDEATLRIQQADAPFAGSFQPAGLLSNLDGEDPNGRWRLVVRDDAYYDGGMLHNWSLDITTDAPAQEEDNPGGDPGGPDAIIDLEGNDVGMGAAAIQVDGRNSALAQGSLDYAGDVDVFRVNVVGGGWFFATSVGAGDDRLAITILDDSGNDVSDWSGSGFAASYLTPGVYFVSVSADDGEAVGEYEVDLFGPNLAQEDISRTARVRAAAVDRLFGSSDWT